MNNNDKPELQGREAEPSSLINPKQDMLRMAADDCDLDYKFLAESIPEILWSAHPDGSPHYHNPQWHDYTGLTPQETRESRWHQVIHNEDLPSCLERWEHSLRTGEPFEMELRFKRADGEYCWHLCRARPQKDAAGKVVRWTGLCTNLDEKKTSERALRQAAKLESIGVLAGGVAHDFNNLLTGILGNISMVLELLPPDHELRDPLDAAVRESNRAAALVKQLLAYSGKGNFKIEPIQLSRLIPELNRLFSTIIPKSVTLETDLQDPLPSIEGDRVQLQQVLMNLIINSAEAIVAGSSGTIRVSTRTQYFAQRFAATLFEAEPIGPGEYVLLEVRDSGSGIDSEDLARIFDPFFTTKFAGRGLGLAATLGIVKGHKAGIVVETAPGCGTAFRIYFPVSHCSES